MALGGPRGARCATHQRAWDTNRALGKRGQGYYTTHLRLMREKGPARFHRCIECGNQAQQWAYDYKDPNEQRMTSESSPYSSDLTHYQPMCIPCHRRLDKSMRESSEPHAP